MRAFLFESAYQVVTWVFITISIAAVFYFLAKGNHRGVLWSVITMVICVAIMIGLIADRYVVSDAPILPTDRPWLSVDVIPAGPITFEKGGATFPIVYRITNRGHSRPMRYE